MDNKYSELNKLSINQKLYRLRKIHKLTREEVSRRTHIHPSTLRKMETTQSYISQFIFYVKLAKLYEVDLNFFNIDVELDK